MPYLVLGSLFGCSAGSVDVAYAFDRLFAALKSDSHRSAAVQSHAINTLRVLFLDGKLSKTVKTFVEQAFVVAVEGFGANESIDHVSEPSS